MKKVIIVGGMAGGCKTAARLRRLSEELDITIIEKLPIVSFAACGMPFFVSGEIDEFGELFSNSWGTLRTNDFFLNSKNIHTLTNHECIKIFPKQNAVLIRNQTTKEEFELSFDFLVIATGSKPKTPPFPISGWERIMYFHNLLDAQKIREMAESGILESVGIIGGGFVGCELAEAFNSLWGINTTIFDCEDYLLSKAFDLEISTILGHLFENNKIKLQLCSKIEAITSKNNKAVVNFEGKVADFDYIFLCAGFEPNSKLAKDMGRKNRFIWWYLCQ